MRYLTLCAALLLAACSSTERATTFAKCHAAGGYMVRVEGYSKWPDPRLACARLSLVGPDSTKAKEGK